MKICIVGVMNIKHMSLISLYTEFFKDKGLDFDIIYIDKYGEEESIAAKNVYKYSMELKREWSKLKKINKYREFRGFAKKILKKNKYDLVILWRTETAYLLLDYLLCTRTKYILNIRDYFNEDKAIFNKITKAVVKKSEYTTISSPKFKEFLPESNYVITHSYNKSVLDKSKVRDRLKDKNSPISIGFIGYVRFFEQDKLLIKKLGNDKRFVVKYFGAGANKLKEYAESEGINNVQFVDSFNVEETSKLLEKIDVINNLYGSKNKALDTAVSIKYYYSVYLKLPILVCKDTYMEEVTKGFGLAIENYENIGDKIYNFYHNLKFQEIDKLLEEKKRKIEGDNLEFYKEISNSVRK